MCESNCVLSLGHVIRNDRRDTLVESVVRDINSKFNIVIARLVCKLPICTLQV